MALGEFSIIERYFTPRKHRRDVVLGVGDDAALLQVPEGMQLAVSMDTLVAGRHFPTGTDAYAIGYKTLAVNLSDMAAMGAEPAWATLSLALPDSSSEFIERFAAGLFSLAEQYDVELVGGDTVRGPLALTLQLHGLVPTGSALLRSGAAVGDYVYVTGTPGDAGVGLALRQGATCDDAADADKLMARLEYPRPRVREGESLRGIASAAIDVSDGLLADLGHILSRSGCGAEVDVDALPLSDALCRCVDGDVERKRLALTAGDDYELCFCIPPLHLEQFEKVSRSWDCPVTRIGRIVEGSGIRLQGEGRAALQQHINGFDHFRGEDG